MKSKIRTDHLITESININTVDIDILSTKKILKLISDEDNKILKSIKKEVGNIERAINLIYEKLGTGGRLFLVGAGTSGRLAVLEAAECPPTFGTSPKLIHAVIAGGSKAVWRSLEGAEDSYDNSRVNLSKLNINKKDVVLGIAASGSTPFVVTAMKYAKKVKASTLMLTFNPVNKKMADIIIAPIVGPEVIVGSTRMKAGTATKMILNMITTTLMIRMGKTYGNLMVDVQPKSQKLRNRARRIVKELVGTNYKKAESLLDESNWEVKTAVVMGIRKVSKIEAKRLLANQKGFLRKALD